MISDGIYKKLTYSLIIPGWRNCPSRSWPSKQAVRKADQGLQRHTCNSRILTPQNAQTQYDTWLDTQHCKPEKKKKIEI